MLNQKVLPALVGERKATVANFKEVKNSNGGYVEVTFKLEDREYKYPIFPGHGATAGKQIAYVTSALRKQLGKESESMTLGEVLEACRKQPISIWFSYAPEYQRMNVQFHSPAVVVESDLDSIEGA